jgi:hypothetical protein
MRGSKKDPFSRPERAVAERREAFGSWVGSRRCLFAAKGQCGGRVEAFELDFGAGSASSRRELPLIPVCEAHCAQRRSEGWDRFLANAALSRTDLVNAAGLLRGRWTRRPLVRPDPSREASGT